eukprot:gene10672-14332_t
MGCGGSVVRPIQGTEATKVEASESIKISANIKTVHGKTKNKIINDKCPHIRLDHCRDTKKIPVKGKHFNLTLKYCYVSQRGYYPNDLSKANQDSYVICESMNEDPNSHFFGVFDGHGEVGDHCSYFAADQVPDQFISELHKATDSSGTADSKSLYQPIKLDDKKFRDVYSRAFMNTNAALHKSKIDDSLSGTTGISIFVKGDKLHIANVGDSRAIIATDIDGKLVYSPLSSDQTPYRKDERERLKKLGAKIMTIDQIEGNEPIHENWGTNLGEEIDEVGDPPRVWDNTLERPGCAFTRSIGDAVAEKCGVTAEPEILEWDISMDDKFAVIASDGVFEFITSQNVIDMIAKFKNPLEAAKHVVAEAYRLWLTYDDRTDDITIIIINFEDIQPVESTLTKESSSNANLLSKTLSARNLEHSHKVLNADRPVRKVLSKAKRKEVSENWLDDSNEDTMDFDSIVNDKTPEEIDRISNMLANNFMFENLTDVQKDQIYKVIKPRNVTANESIIREGDPGDEMYLIDSGEFTVYKRDENGVNNAVFVYTIVGSAFGELSLMYGKPRAASVAAKTNGKLWCLSRSAFRCVVMKGASSHGSNNNNNNIGDSNGGLMKVYRTIPFFQDLNNKQIHRLCMNSIQKSYAKNESILHENDLQSCDWILLIIFSGILRLLPKYDVIKRQLRSELMFISSSELGTKYSEIKADNNAKVMIIPKSVYMDILGRDGEAVVSSSTNSLKVKGKGLKPSKSIFSMEDKLQIMRLDQHNNVNNKSTEDVLLNVKDRFKLDHPILCLDDHMGYIGTFNDVLANGFNSIKVISKINAFKHKMDIRLLQERQFIAALQASVNSNDNNNSNENNNTTKIHLNYISCLPLIAAIYSDEKLLYIIYNEVFICDLSLAIANNAITDELKPFYASCLYRGMTALHENGLIHRSINPSSVYITGAGVPKISDLRFAKRMAGLRSYTICGDPLYFAPEIISHKGYDFGSDLWSFGILLFEMYEGAAPFGNSDTEETSIYKAISAYRNHKLKNYFTEKTPNNAKDLISHFLDSDVENRYGYFDEASVVDHPYFKDINWDSITTNSPDHLNIQPTIDSAQMFDEDKIEPFNSAVFDKF